MWGLQDSHSVVRFKLIAGLGDPEIKEDILSVEDKSLDETVKAFEFKAGSNLGQFFLSSFHVFVQLNSSFFQLYSSFFHLNSSLGHFFSSLFQLNSSFFLLNSSFFQFY